MQPATKGSETMVNNHHIHLRAIMAARLLASADSARYCERDHSQAYSRATPAPPSATPPRPIKIPMTIVVPWTSGRDAKGGRYAVDRGVGADRV